jgi:pentatricopeptide repeat protein
MNEHQESLFTTMKLPQKNSILLLLCLGLANLAMAQDDSFTRANAAYQQGRPEDAVSLYESMQKAGTEDASLYYNLGNAYAAQGTLGKAILSYVRSLRLDPGAEDVRANLLLARRAAAENAEPPRVGPLPSGPEDELGGTKTVAQLGWQAFYLYAVGFFLMGVALLSRRRQRQLLAQIALGLSVFAFSGALSFAFVSWRRAAAHAEDRRAVVLAPNTSVRRGPIENAESLYALPEGEIISIEERRDNWCLVRLAGRPEGWVSLSQVEPVLR